MNHPSIEMIATVAPVFKSLNMDVLYVGGSVVPLYVPEYLWNWVRPTNDVDGIVEVATHREFALLERKLEAKGFLHDTREGAPICRWTFNTIVVDIMPDNESVLGFSNQWYQEGRPYTEKREIKPGIIIRILPAAFFIATKIDAFLSRGKKDYWSSPDMEDIICILDGCGRDALTELLQSPKTVLDHIAKQFSKFQKYPDFLDSVSGHIEPGMTHDERVREVLAKIKSLSDGIPVA